MTKRLVKASWRWLPPNHTYRSGGMKDHFDGKIEVRPKPEAVTVQEQLRHAAEYQAWRDAGNRPGAPGDPSKVHGVKRKSILNRLPYWEVCKSHYTSWLTIIAYEHWIWPNSVPIIGY
jgi:hypothetical protein